MPRAALADRPLTVKQQKFAAAVAGGKPKTVARRENYVETPGFPKATSRRASELAAKPHVAAEIRRLTWLGLPVVDDVRGMREHSVRVLSDLSRSAESEEVRFKAAVMLYKIAETTLAAAGPGVGATEQDKLLASLRKLYTEVQGTKPSPAAATEIDDDEPIDIQAIAVREPVPATSPQEPGPLAFETETAGSSASLNQTATSEIDEAE